MTCGALALGCQRFRSLAALGARPHRRLSVSHRFWDLWLPVIALLRPISGLHGLWRLATSCFRCASGAERVILLSDRLFCGQAGERLKHSASRLWSAVRVRRRR